MSLGYVPGCGVGLWLINVFFQRVLRIDSSCPFSKHFTSRLLHGDRLVIENESLSVRLSLASSGGCYINACDGLKIGRGTVWAPNVAIVAQDRDRVDFAKSPPTSPIIIGEECWLGFGCTILPGVTLGNHTIVGANAVVTQSFPEGNMVVAGVPAKIVRRLVLPEAAEQS